MNRAALALVSVVLTCSCHPATRFGEPGKPAEFRGYVSCEFERSSFLPCGTKEPYWIDCHDPNWADVVSVLDACELQRCSIAGAYVEVDGSLTPVGHHGHLGMWKRELTPTRVHYASGVGPDSCGWSPPAEWTMAL